MYQALLQNCMNLGFLHHFQKLFGGVTLGQHIFGHPTQCTSGEASRPGQGYYLTFISLRHTTGTACAMATLEQYPGQLHLMGMS